MRRPGSTESLHFDACHSRIFVVHWCRQISRACRDLTSCGWRRCWLLASLQPQTPHEGQQWGYSERSHDCGTSIAFIVDHFARFTLTGRHATGAFQASPRRKPTAANAAAFVFFVARRTGKPEARFVSGGRLHDALPRAADERGPVGCAIYVSLVRALLHRILNAL